MPAQDQIYVVYPYAADRYMAVKVHKRMGNATIHDAIAKYENNEEKSGRRWAEPIEAGSFNVAKIADARTAEEAVKKAKELGLAYEPKPTVLARYKQSQEGLKREFDTMRAGAKPSGDFGKAFDDIFGDLFGKNGPRR